MRFCRTGITICYQCPFLQNVLQSLAPEWCSLALPWFLTQGQSIMVKVMICRDGHAADIRECSIAASAGWVRTGSCSTPSIRGDAGAPKLQAAAPFRISAALCAARHAGHALPTVSHVPWRTCTKGESCPTICAPLYMLQVSRIDARLCL